MNSQNIPIKKRIILRAEHILRFLIGEDSQLDNLVIFHSDKYELTASDAGLYQALGSVKEYDHFSRAKLVKFLEAVRIMPAHKRVLTHERVSELRLKALKKKEKKEDT